MKNLSRGLILFASIIVPSLVSAHPGHDHADGSNGFTITHYLTTPVHIITSLAVVAIVVGIWRAINIRNQQSKN